MTWSRARRATRIPICPRPSSITRRTPREYFLSAITTVLDVQTRVSDLYSRPFDQIQEQLRLLIEKVKETQESELINNPEYGLLASAAPSMTHPDARRRADARRSRRADRAGVEGARVLPRPSRGDRGLRARMHAARRAATDGQSVRLALPHLARPAARSVRQAAARRAARARSSCSAPARRSRASSACSSRAFRARSARASRSASWASTARRSRSYLVSLYSSLAVLTEDALGVLDNVEVGKYHAYDHTYARAVGGDALVLGAQAVVTEVGRSAVRLRRASRGSSCLSFLDRGR